MSCDHADSIRHIANLILRKYNYLANSDFSLVHYYNGNSFSSTPYQNQRGTISVPDESHQGPRTLSGLNRTAIGETRCIGRNQVRSIPGLDFECSAEYPSLEGDAA